MHKVKLFPEKGQRFFSYILLYIRNFLLNFYLTEKNIFCFHKEKLGQNLNNDI